MRTKQCKCGHHARAHRGPATECDGLIRTGKNAVGAPQVEWCRCASFRPSERSWWQRRVTMGTEEREC